MRAAYPSDLSDAEWDILKPLIPAARQDVRPRKYEMREIINGVRYLQRSGCAWRMLPHDFPPYRAVFYYFRQWRKDGTWERIHDALYRQLRLQIGRQAEASAGSVDSQSVKTTEKGGSRAMTGLSISRDANAIC
jgi:putative transposase